MESIRKSLSLVATLLLLAAVRGQAAEAASATNTSNTVDVKADVSTAARRAGVAGRVTAERSALPAAGVYAYQLADLSLHKVVTDASGNFRFDALPAGLYKIIAHKAGFLPAVVLITRTTAEAFQFLELQLAAQQPLAIDGFGAAGEDFWSVRSRIPPDVLRDILGPQEVEAQTASWSAPSTPSALAGFQTEMQALTGVDQVAGGAPGQVQGGQLGFEGQLGSMQVGVSGRFLQLASGNGEVGRPEAADGQTRLVSVDLEHGPDSRFKLTSLNNRLVTREDGREAPVEVEHYGVSWSQALGENGRSDISAEITTQNNYHRHGWLEPVDIPEASRDWRVEGTYTSAFSDRSTLQGGFRYRETQSGLNAVGGGTDPLFDSPGRASVDLFGLGGTRLRPAVLVEYGLYTTLRDGSVSLTPRGGVVLQLGQQWQTEASVSRRAYETEGAPIPDFLPTLYHSSDVCEQGSEACYELSLARRSGEDGLISLGAVRRTVGDTSRLYFSDDFFDRRHSLYLVRGDELPGLQLKVQGRVAPQVLAKLESNVAAGGGGVFFATDRHAYENQVSYQVTSLDTQFQSTLTGVFLAFYRLAQELEPVGAAAGEQGGPGIEVERLRLMLSQDLGLLLDVGADWAVQLDLEVSRGDDPAALPGEDDLKKRFVGGLAVKF